MPRRRHRQAVGSPNTAPCACVATCRVEPACRPFDPTDPTDPSPRSTRRLSPSPAPPASAGARAGGPRLQESCRLAPAAQELIGRSTGRAVRAESSALSMAAEGRPPMPERRLERAREHHLTEALQAPPQQPQLTNGARAAQTSSRTSVRLREAVPVDLRGSAEAHRLARSSALSVTGPRAPERLQLGPV